MDVDVFTPFGGYKTIKFVWVGALYFHDKKILAKQNVLNIVVGLVYFIITLLLCITLLCYSFYDQSTRQYVFLYRDHFDAVMITGTHKPLLLLTTDKLLVRCIVWDLQLGGTAGKTAFIMMQHRSLTYLNILKYYTIGNLFLLHRICYFHIV